MKITYYSVTLNHHQVHIADEFYRLLNDDFVFVETECIDDAKGDSTDYSKRKYLVQSWKDKQSFNYAMSLAQSSDVCIFGGYKSLIFQKERLKRNLLSFEMSERWLKRGWLSLLSYRLLSYQWYYHTSWYNKQLYKLCCSGYTAKDQRQMHSFKGRCYKWGYFTKTVLDFNVNRAKARGEKIKIMWCARFLKLKHPELVVHLAKELKNRDYAFEINMYGDGPEFINTKNLAEELNVNDVLHIMGSRPHNDILSAMLEHDIFLFTSDRNEGWGVVANECMLSGCVLVISDEIGCTPFLINDGDNGFVFRSCDLQSLCSKVNWILDHKEEINRISINATKTIQEVWSPQRAVNNFLLLSRSLLSNTPSTILEGPCSISE